MYAAAQSSRLTMQVARSTSANAELYSSLQVLRDRSRALIRDSAYAKRAQKIIVDNVIGTGIGMQPGVKSTRGELRKAVNSAISDAFWKWCEADSCHVGGKLHFCDLERLAMGQVFEAGEIIVRLHMRPFGDSEVPLALEVIEPERIADELDSSPSMTTTKVIHGVEVDRFYRPINYLLKQVHPGERSVGSWEVNRVELVPASQIIHLHVVDRWPQVRGVPWLHAVIGKLADINGYTEAEIVAARAAANYFAAIESPEDAAAFAEEQDDGSFELAVEPGTVAHLKPGEKLNVVSPNRPNAALDPFLRYMLREMAAGCSVSYESLSRDYSQATYSSARQALLEDRDAFRAIQQWFIRDFRARLHRVWMQQAVLSGAIQGLSAQEYGLDPYKFGSAAFKPRGWSWVDPTKEVEAYKEAVKAGFTTVTDVIAQTDPQGRDADEVFDLRERELEDMDERDLVFDTSPDSYIQLDSATPAAPVAADQSNEVADQTDAEQTRVVHLRR